MFIVYRLRHGPLVNVGHLVHIMPQLIVDFLSPMEVLQLVVTDFVSPHQTRPQLSGTIMAEVYMCVQVPDHCVYYSYSVNEDFPCSDCC